MLKTSLKKLLARCQSGVLGSAKRLRHTRSETTIRGALNRRRSSEVHSIEGKHLRHTRAKCLRCTRTDAHIFLIKKDKTLDLKIFSQIGNKVNSKYYHEHPLTCNILIMCTYLINPELTYLLHGLRSV